MHKKWTVISAVFALVAALVVVPAAIVLFGGLLGVVLVGLRRTYGAARSSRRRFRSVESPDSADADLRRG